MFCNLLSATKVYVFNFSRLKLFTKCLFNFLPSTFKVLAFHCMPVRSVQQDVKLSILLL